jgi:polygalacturonase
MMKRLRPRQRPILTAVFLLALSGATPGFAADAAGAPSIESVAPALPAIPARVFKLTDFGAIGNGRTLNTAAFRKALAAVEKAGGGKLVVPKGIFRTGPVSLCSNLELHLEAGAVVQAPDTFEALGLPNPATFKNQADADTALKTPDSLINGKNLHDVAITGPGTIDGAGALWWAWSNRPARDALAGGQPGRIVLQGPALVAFDSVQRLLVSEVTFANSPHASFSPRRVSDVTVDRLKIRTPIDDTAPPNSAIALESVTRAWLHHVDLGAGPNDVVIKSGTGILIEDCAFNRGQGLSLFSEMPGGVSGVFVRRCSFDGPENGIWIKTIQGAGGPIENVRYADITMKNVPNPIVLQIEHAANTRPAFPSGESRTNSAAIRNITIDHTTIEAAQNAAIIRGLPESMITGVTLRDVRISAENDFDVRDADDPIFERVHTAIITPSPR